MNFFQFTCFVLFLILFLNPSWYSWQTFEFLFYSMTLLCYSLSREVINRPRPNPFLLYEEKEFHTIRVENEDRLRPNKSFRSGLMEKGWFLIRMTQSHLLRSAPNQTRISNTCTQLLNKWFPFQTIRKIKRRLIYITMLYAHLSCHGHDDVMCHWWHKQLLILLNNIIYWRKAWPETCNARTCQSACIEALFPRASTLLYSLWCIVWWQTCLKVKT